MYEADCRFYRNKKKRRRVRFDLLFFPAHKDVSLSRRAISVQSWVNMTSCRKAVAQHRARGRREGEHFCIWSRGKQKNALNSQYRSFLGGQTRAKTSIITLQMSLPDTNEIGAAVFHTVPLCHIITGCIVSPSGLFKSLHIHTEGKKKKHNACPSRTDRY